MPLPASEVFILEMGNSSVELIHGGNGSSFNFSINPDHGVIIPGDNNRVAFANLMPGIIYNVSINVIDEDLESSFLLRLRKSLSHSCWLLPSNKVTCQSLTLHIRSGASLCWQWQMTAIGLTMPVVSLCQERKVIHCCPCVLRLSVVPVKARSYMKWQNHGIFFVMTSNVYSLHFYIL